MSEEMYAKLAQAVIDGEPEDAELLAKQALEQGLDPLTCVNEGLTKGIQKVGDLFASGEYFLPELIIGAEAMKKALKIPIITPSIHDPVKAEKALREGKTDMVSLGRSILADSAWVKKVKDGQYKKIVKCIRCLTCNRRIRDSLSIRCEVNPRLGMEQYMPENHRVNAPHRKVFHYPRL